MIKNEFATKVTVLLDIQQDPDPRQIGCTISADAVATGDILKLGTNHVFILRGVPREVTQAFPRKLGKLSSQYLIDIDLTREKLLINGKEYRITPYDKPWEDRCSLVREPKK